MLVMIVVNDIGRGGNITAFTAHLLTQKLAYVDKSKCEVYQTLPSGHCGY